MLEISDYTSKNYNTERKDTEWRIIGIFSVCVEHTDVYTIKHQRSQCI